ncbi:hypothetical protein BT96DRAFT_1098305 [Gymnopus androsaceus JB14]|uniref:CHAT domain-containing protein n=1 Tax=Gymnopus androsaceus JB14 TaxID=1447944 RepID=A0A6A4HTM8_9AGAR|nr:hypothetical protein BT96DRAFT_1098305 [Gymnopus androsaceus JB14]
MSNKYHQYALQRENIITEIRKKPGFETFLLPKSIGALADAARMGPVILLNASDQQCDALVLVNGLREHVVHIPLPDVSYSDLKNKYSKLQGLLQNCGHLPFIPRDSDVKRLGIRKSRADQTNTVARPIVKKLNLKTSSLQRIWWCPSGIFSFLPLHAAGDYSSNASPGTKLCDYAISSYTPSVNALLEAFNASSSLGPVHTAPQLLAISQSYDLPGTVEELNFIKSQARDVVSVKTLVGSEATIEEVKEQMKKSD